MPAGVKNKIKSKSKPAAVGKPTPSSSATPLKDSKEGGKKPTSARSAAKRTKTSVGGKEIPRQKIRIKIRAYDHKVIDKSTKQIIEAAEQSGAEVVGPIPLPTSKSKTCVLKSTFVHKDSRDQYEMRVHKRLVDIVKPTSRTIDSLMDLSLPAGVDIEIKM